MGRYLIFMSYIGTRYHGLQIQRIQGHEQIKTVQGVLEKLLRKINPWHETRLITSSRTDAGVHALCNSMHFDFLHKHHPEKEYYPDLLTCRLNSLLKKSNEDIRVISIQQVNDDFNSRYKAISRSYVYRLAISHQPGYSDLQPLSVMDQKMILNVLQPFNTELFLRSVELLGGTHDFSAFTTENFLQREPQKNPIKTMTVGITKGQSLQDVCLKPETPNLDYWDLHFHSSSFLYHQVRRMVGAVLQIGRGKMSMDDLRRVLEEPSHRKSLSQSTITAVPPWGLYLKEVHYDPKDLVYTPSDIPLMNSDLDLSSDDQRTEQICEMNLGGNQERVIPYCNMDHWDKSFGTDRNENINEEANS